MSIDERLTEIRHAIDQTRVWLDTTEALLKRLVDIEKPSLEMLARVMGMMENREGDD